MQNDAMPGLVKIGLTSRLAEDRAQELFTTGLPSPFQVVFRALTSNPRELEKEVHRQLKDRRLKNNREFFSMTPVEAMNTILSVRRKVDSIESWAGKMTYLHDGDRLLLSLRAGQVFIIFAFPFVGAPEADVVDIWQAHTDKDTLELYCTDSAEYTSGFSDNDPFSNQDPIPFLNRTGTAGNDIMFGRERLVPGDRLLWVDDTGNPNLIGTLFEMSCYCQVVGRTRQPIVASDSGPLSISCVTRDKLSHEVLSLGQYVLKMPPPRNWAPRHGGPEWIQTGTIETSAEFWLEQLKIRNKAKKKE